jgi:hypothetical protein
LRLRLPTVAGDDVDGSGEARGAVEGGQGTADDLDALDAGGGQPFEVEDVSHLVGRVVERHAVEEDEGEVGLAGADLGGAEAAPAVGGHAHPGHKAEEVSHGAGARGFDGLAVDHRHRAGGGGEGPGLDGRGFIEGLRGFLEFG